MDIINLKTQKLTKIVKDKQITKLNMKLTSSQSSSSSRKSRVPKQLIYFSSIINRFNLKLQGDTTIVNGLNEADKNKP